MVRAKFTCAAKIPYSGGVVVHMYPVYSADPDSENKAFTDATPGGALQIQIADGKPAADEFEQGKAYYVDFSRAD